MTVTIGGKPPTRVASTSPLTPYGPGAIQTAIDTASPGDLIIIPPGVYDEMVLMWKPVRLQGVGAASSIINANTQPAGKLDPWRRQVNCLFGLAINGQPYTPGRRHSFQLTNTNPYDSSGQYLCPGTDGNYYTGGSNNPQVDRIALEGIVGWDATVNGNLAQQLQEPSLMGAYEGAGITVLAKGVKYPASGTYIFGNGPDTGVVATEGQFPLGTRVLGNTNGDCSGTFASNFQCNPSAIDGLSITDASQGGGGIFLHGWAHNIQIANNRVYNNIGTLSGGINVGQGETPDALIAGNNGDPLAPTGGFDQQPWTCLPGSYTIDPVTGVVTQNPNPGGVANGVELPFCLDLHVNVHNNSIVQNTSIGDELFSGTPAGAGGVSFSPGSDYYTFTSNWVCGNISTGDGGGVSHLGFSVNGDIEHNTIIFNQSTNPTLPTNGGGLIVMGTAPDGSSPTQPECGSTTSDVDCPPGLSDGTGPGLTINANLIMGNAAESGSGGGLRFQSVNGTEVSRFYNSPSNWYSVNVTNNIIANNVAGWDGGGVSLQDALVVNLVNNTIASNDSTASAGPLFNTIGAANASAPGATNQCQTTSCTTSAPQPGGLVTMSNSGVLTASFTGLPPITCPTANPGCAAFSNPYLANDLFWQNRSYYIGVGSLSTQYQQNILTLYNSFATTPTPAPSQPSTPSTTANGGGVTITGGTGACTTAAYWDIGARGDTGPGNHASTYTLAPRYSLLTQATEIGNGTNNLTGTANNPDFISQYCNGSRIPPEAAQAGGTGWQVPPGISDATVPNPIFNLTPAATVDEGNNWVNIQWGPLALTNPVTGATLGNYALAAGSPAIDHIPTSSPTYSIAPKTDFFGNSRPDVASTAIDIGAVEYRAVAPTLLSISPVNGLRNSVVPVTLSGTHLSGTTAVTVSGAGITVSGIAVASDSTVTATFTISSSATLSARTVSVTTPGGASGNVTFTVLAASLPTLTSIVPVSGARGTTVPVTLTGTNLTGATAVTVTGTGVTASGIVVVNSTSVTANFVISATATLGGRTVNVTTPGGTTTPGVTFTVTAPSAPTLTSIGPVSGLRGATVPVTLTGTNFTTTGTTVAVTGTGITVSGVTVVSSTSITATFTISGSATLGARTVTVATPGGTTSPGVTFTVTGPTLTSIAPPSGARGTVVPVTLTGTGLTGSTVVTVSGGSVTVSNITVVNDTTVTATFTITAGATLSARNVSITAPGGATNTVAFEVTGATVTISAPNPVLTTGTPNTNLKNGTITVSNTATGATAGPLTLTAAPTITKLTGTGVFTIMGGTCVSGFVVNAGSNCTILVQYAPVGTANSTANVSIAGTGLAASPQTSATFTGN